MTELKPCPFCGCSVRLESEKSYDEWIGPRTWYYVRGDHKGIGGACPGEVRGRGSAETAIAAWNTRADDARIRELEAERDRLRKMVNPTWFYHPDYPETCYFSPWEVIDEGYDPAPGEYVYEVDCATSMPSIWCAVHVSDDPDADERFTLTEHASEAEARAALAGDSHD